MAQVLDVAVCWRLVLVAEMILGFAVRDKVKAITASVSAPATELRLLGELLARLEQEHFQSRLLDSLSRGLERGADPASRGNPAVGARGGAAGLGAQSIFPGDCRAVVVDSAVRDCD